MVLYLRRVTTKAREATEALRKESAEMDIIHFLLEREKSCLVRVNFTTFRDNPIFLYSPKQYNQWNAEHYA